MVAFFGLISELALILLLTGNAAQPSFKNLGQLAQDLYFPFFRTLVATRFKTFDSCAPLCTKIRSFEAYCPNSPIKPIDGSRAGACFITNRHGHQLLGPSFGIRASPLSFLLFPSSRPHLRCRSLYCLISSP